jgi:hypothetical protein
MSNTSQRFSTDLGKTTTHPKGSMKTLPSSPFVFPPYTSGFSTDPLKNFAIHAKGLRKTLARR